MPSSRQIHGAEDSKSLFVQRLSRARDLPTLILEMAAEGKPQNVGGEDLPEATLVRMTHWAHVEYRGLLRLVEDPPSAFAAEVLLRALVEYFAHALWIAEGIPDAVARTPRCRALCLELGMAEQALINVNNAVTAVGLPTSDATTAYATKVRESAITRLADVKPLHDAEGCTCAGRKWKGVGDTVWGLRNKHGITWPQEIWSITSAAAHQLLPDRILRDLGDGSSELLEQAPWEWRSDMLDYAVGCIGLAGVAILGLVNPTLVDALGARLEDFLGPLLTKV